MNSTRINCQPRPLSIEAESARLPSLTALYVQFGAGLATCLLAWAWAAFVFPALPLLAWAAVQGGLALLLCTRVGMARWWRPIHGLFAPLAALALGLHLPPYLFLAGFLALIVVHGATFRTQVPLHVSRREAVRLAAMWLPDRPGFRCLDLGCGTGAVLGQFIRLRPEGRYSGIEGAPLPYVVSLMRGAIDGFDVSWGDIWSCDLGEYDVVFAYLSPACMPRLWAKAQREMKPGSLLISNEFAIPGIAPDASVPVGDSPIAVHLWRIGDAPC